MTKRSIWIGYDSREAQAYSVACESVKRRLTQPIPVRGVVLGSLISNGLYTRPTKRTVDSEGNRRLVDVFSVRDDYDGSMATEFAVSRFLVPHLAKEGWALFMDCDMLALADIVEAFDLFDSSKAVMCVKHNHQPKSAIKMDGQLQTKYEKKNWSSFVGFNCDHPANEALTLDLINTARGIDLHRFCWLDDGLIGELPVEWNWLSGHSSPDVEPKVVHYTDGGPWIPHYMNVPYADVWLKEKALCLD